ncbi:MULTISPECIES: hypothetical protein [unclassified Mesorhizobium]|uniref:hypothetical protein n=1 Tax=unclassified Mesorhizobium TaxID=325217 RepID=UPI00112802D7|nr:MULTISPECIES: hypothetical protein [unclassified Mesorhizobium]MBZ9998552.1 hypothetical protein [Mesorhizobium sp. B264B2A]MCA0005097.1 hypothetical protein [Mesorhizobium sp. B264B1B]MCA0019723.1 hypothetical protein [Mesorhizobium sp. B264B1A]TPJ45700.1 hypothetical protein FJ437_15860 [Mesorhizobium sp. B2-6-6]
MTLDEYLGYRQRVVELDPDAMKKVETKSPPIDAADFVLRVSYVILNSGMRWTVAQDIWSRLKPALIETGEVGDTFGHPGKKKSINQVVSNRSEFFEEFQSAWENGPGAVIEFCETLPHIGGITKYHLAKNLGVDVAKPDVWLERVAAKSGETVHELCGRLSKQSGDSVSTVDYVIWKACQQGWRQKD